MEASIGRLRQLRLDLMSGSGPDLQNVQVPSLTVKFLCHLEDFISVVRQLSSLPLGIQVCYELG